MIQIELLEDGICDSTVLYAFRDKKTQLLVGYDGYDTDFYRGISAFLREHEIVSELNKKLVTKTHPEILALLTDVGMNDKQWKDLGGFINLEVVRLNIEVTGDAYHPVALLNLINNDDIDYVEVYGLEND